MFKNKRVEIVDIATMNETLKLSSWKNVVFGPCDNNYIGPLNMYIDDEIIKIDVTTRVDGKPITYRFFKDGSSRRITITGAYAYNLLRRMAKFHIYTKEELITNSFIGSASPLLYCKEKKQVHDKCIGYDINSAYSWAMLQPIPDTSESPKEHCIVGDGEIGFTQTYEKGRYRLYMVERGFPARWVFKAIESPFQKFVRKYYDIKKCSEKAERDKAKQILNYAVGYLQRKNPFIRACIVGRCNNRIQKLIDKYNDEILYANTDAIVSTKEIDLKLSEEIGDWKVEHYGRFANKLFNFQWEGERASIRGVSKNWLQDFDILKDTLPKDNNRYELNYSTLQMEVKNG